MPSRPTRRTGWPKVRIRAAPVGGAGPAEAVPDALSPQVPIILQVLAAAGLATAGAEGYEADDVIGTLGAREADDPVEVVSGDRDLLQVVREKPTPVRVLYAGRGLAKAELFGSAELAAKIGCPRSGPVTPTPRWRCCAATRPTGCPAWPGVGRRPRPRVISQFGSWAELLDR